MKQIAKDKEDQKEDADAEERSDTSQLRQNKSQGQITAKKEAEKTIEQSQVSKEADK
jgi:hypothetical protein